MTKKMIMQNIERIIEISNDDNYELKDKEINFLVQNVKNLLENNYAITVTPYTRNNYISLSNYANKEWTKKPDNYTDDEHIGNMYFSLKNLSDDLDEIRKEYQRLLILTER